ncbi:response regulator [Ramlibacter sp. AW1]|uniref:Virulence sensor protein BvgS n=1 Tax=Ramlibacter aurantiacus TaxID=2801330 RepID=A0A936ZR00_9BURK|nr:PAS domain-containing hybrid sensor histidine kinase/response regulator [Ramlibacter aurantiacus]MBL0422005.1 response regulator [Ramlibacter aurantiacus]
MIPQPLYPLADIQPPWPPQGEPAASGKLSAEDRLELALRASGLGLWEYTPADDRVVLWASWQQILGFSPDARTVASQQLAHLGVGETAEAFRDALLALAADAGVAQFSIEHEVTKASGARIWVQTEGQVTARDGAGRVLHVIGTTKNITESKRHQSALQAAVEAAEQAKRARADFLATMSHEIRTPLNGVIGLSRVLQESELPAREAGYVNLINSCAHALLGLVNDVLDFSKIDAGQMVLEPAACDLHALLEEIGGLFLDRARAKSVCFELRRAPELPRYVTVDPQRLRQILLNLLGNALKFTDRGGFALSVDMGSLARQRSLLFAVTDTGIGISPLDQARLFQRFSQVDASSTRRFQGSGLGLAISRDLALLMGGDIRVSSAPGSGSTFTLEIPLVPAATGPVVQPAQRVLASTAPLLLVEDNPINQMVARALLEKLGFAQVTTAVHGEDALRLCREQSFALVLMDCQMPVMDGFEATRQLRASGFTMPIVALTAGAVSDDRDRCLACGMNDYLAKPIDAALLGGVLDFWLSGGTRGEPAAVRRAT